MQAIGQAVGGQGIAYQYHLLRGQPLQQHRHGGGHMHPIGDQPKGHVAPQGRRRHGARGAVVHVRNGVEGMGHHRHAGVVGVVGLAFGGLAVAQAHHHPLLAQGADHRGGPLQFRRQGHQGDVGRCGSSKGRPNEAIDPLRQGRQ